MTTVSARIPFADFYGSIWDNEGDSQVESTMYNWRDDAWDNDRERVLLDLPSLTGIENPDWQTVENALFDATDWGVYRANVAQAYADEFVAWLGDTLGQPVSGTFEEMTSPREYNFETDRLFVQFDVASLEAIRDSLSLSDIAESFRRLFTSRDGFISSYDNTAPDKPLAEWDHNEVYALLCAFTDANLDRGQSIDMELYDYRCGGLYEIAANAFSEAVDWKALDAAVASSLESDA